MIILDQLQTITSYYITHPHSYPYYKSILNHRILYVVNDKSHDIPLKVPWNPPSLGMTENDAAASLPDLTVETQLTEAWDVLKPKWYRIFSHVHLSHYYIIVGFIYSFIYFLFTDLFMCLFIYLFIYLSIYYYLFIYLFIYLRVTPEMSQSTHEISI